MDAHLTSPTSYRAGSIDDPLSQIARQSTALAAALVLLLCVFVAIRGSLGAFEAPESATFLVLVAITAELLASVFRIVWLRLHPGATRWSVLLTRLGLPSICVICVAIALSMTQEKSWPVASLWLVVAGGEFAWWHPELRAARHRISDHLAAVAVDLEVSDTVEVDDEHVDEEGEIAADVIQQVTRSRNDEGVEVISGVLRAEFTPGERTHNLHVAFCPPLAYDPAVITHQLDGSPLTIKVGQTEIFGTRIELRRAEAAGPAESATIYFEVQPR